MKLRSQLTLLTLAALLPVAILAAVLGGFLIEHQRDLFRRGTQDRVHALLTAIDTELKGSIDVLRALASVRSIDDGNLGLFRETAAQVMKEHSDWATVNLALPDGQQILNHRVPQGQPLPRIADDGTLARIAATMKPAVGDMAFGPTTRQWDFAVRVPVARDGKLLYIMSAVERPEVIGRLLASQQLPPDWEGMVIDRNGRIVARSAGPPSVGEYAPEELRAALKGPASGWYRGASPESGPKYVGYRRSEATGWAFAMAVPTQAVDAIATRAAWIFVLALAAAIVLALGLARVLGLRIAEPMTMLASAADRLARGEKAEFEQVAGLDELSSLAGALRNAAGAQGALRRAEEQTRSIVDNVLDGIISIDERGAIESFNRAAERLFGYGASEVIGKNVKLLMPQPYRAGHDGYIENFLATGVPKIIGIGREVSGMRKNGSTFPMELAVSEFRIGAARFFTGIVRDITERKRTEEAIQESERRFRVMADSAPIMIWVVDTRANIQFINRAYREFFGVTVEDVLGPNWQPLVHPEDAPQYVASFLESLAARQAWTARARVRRADGEWRWIESRSNPRFSESGEFLGAVGSSPDITEQIERERALREADRHKDEFLAMLSHELRNPLAALTTAAHVLRAAAPQDPTTADAQGVIDRQTGHMVRLIEDLLDITRVRLGKLSLKREAVDLAELVSEVTRAKRDAGAFKARAEVELKATVAWVHGDRARLEQVYANLLDNALKFTPAGGTIRVSVGRRGGEAILSVADTGRGIAPEALPSVFELFVQGEQDLERAQGGLGLGLALVRRLVELHGGRVAAASDGRGRGATFTVSLPAIEASALAVAGAREPAAQRVARRILLVEDNEDARHMLRAVLTMQGHEVREAASGTSGLEAARTCDPDVVLLDIGLPDMDGYEVARRVRALPRGPSMVLIAISGYGQDDDRGRAQAAGFDAHVVKPADAELLAAVIAECAIRKRGPVA